MTRTNHNLDRAAFVQRITVAGQEAEFLIKRLGISKTPVDPIQIAATEGRLLRLCPGNYKNAFDGRLEYLPELRCFLCYYNTKYDCPSDDGHAPRTRFSLGHELAHYFIESHHEYLRAGGRTHPSKSEFLISTPVEQQADAFAAHLLMPDRLFKPLVNQGELSIDIIADLARTFRTSFVSTARRAIECTHFFCAVAAIRDGAIAWIWRGDPLVEKGIYPGPNGPVRSLAGQQAWHAYCSQSNAIPSSTGWARDWFRIYDDDLKRRLPVIESYLPARVMDTLIVLLTVPEDELWDDDHL